MMVSMPVIWDLVFTFLNITATLFKYSFKHYSSFDQCFFRAVITLSVQVLAIKTRSFILFISDSTYINSMLSEIPIRQKRYSNKFKIYLFFIERTGLEFFYSDKINLYLFQCIILNYILVNLQIKSFQIILLFKFMWIHFNWITNLLRTALFFLQLWRSPLSLVSSQQPISELLRAPLVHYLPITAMANRKDIFRTVNNF